MNRQALSICLARTGRLARLRDIVPLGKTASAARLALGLAGRVEAHRPGLSPAAHPAPRVE